MQIVIDISEDSYKKIISDKYIFDVSVREKIYHSIKSGAQLHKGHGRLIDAEELKTAFPCGESVRTECVRATIDYAPTVIEADK